jgi:uncharacterized membrane protein
VSDRPARLALLVAAALGAGISGYLTVVHYRGGAPVCTNTGCEVVQRSRYAELAGVPVALLGLMLFGALVVLAGTRVQIAIVGSAVLAFAAVGFATYLAYVQLAVLHAVCTWCVASDGLTAVAALAAGVRLRLLLK